MISMRQVLIYFSVKYGGDWDRIREAISRKERVSDEEALAAIKDIRSNTVTLIDEDYPLFLKQSFCPPFVLYYKGNLQLTAAKCKLGVIGSRDISDYGEKTIDKLIPETASLLKEAVVISGMAKGVDSEAERKALACHLPTISVLGCGIDVCYPSSSQDVYGADKSSNLLISEYPDGTKPQKEFFPQRNRIIAGLLDALLIIEADEKSGTAITVKYALEAGKDIICVPSSILTSKQLCNALIKDGAGLVTCGADIAAALSKPC
jgi:DNA processing protein